jgi:hypothetical protein
MAREPHYPDDAAVGSEGAAAAPEDKAPAAGGDPKRRKHMMAGAAIGIGSAAIVAALLYANRKGRHDRGSG